MYKPPPVGTSPLPGQQPKPIFAEANRRDAIIREMVAKLPYKAGDWTSPVDAKDVEKYGTRILIEAVCDSYAKFGKGEDWPKHDFPMIIHAFSEKNNNRFTCTPNFLQKV